MELKTTMDTLENAQKRAEYWKAEHAAANAEIETLRRQFAIAKRQWDNWKEEAMRLNARLQKYEPGSPMLLNSAVPTPEFRGVPGFIGTSPGM